jgi:hypothetical protein
VPQGTCPGLVVGGCLPVVCAGRRVLTEGGVSEGTPLTNETELFALAVLRAANRTQARGTTVRLVVPRAAEVAGDLGIEVAEERIVAVEEWLVERGYLAQANVGLA